MIRFRPLYEKPLYDRLPDPRRIKGPEEKWTQESEHQRYGSNKIVASKPDSFATVEFRQKEAESHL